MGLVVPPVYIEIKYICICIYMHIWTVDVSCYLSAYTCICIDIWRYLYQYSYNSHAIQICARIHRYMSIDAYIDTLESMQATSVLECMLTYIYTIYCWFVGSKHSHWLLVLTILLWKTTQCSLVGRWAFSVMISELWHFASVWRSQQLLVSNLSCVDVI